LLAQDDMQLGEQGGLGERLFDETGPRLEDSLQAAAIEIVDSRIAGWRIKLADTISDLASSGAVVLGPAASPVDAAALRLAGLVFARDGEVVATGAGAAALGGPLEAAAWLARTLAGLGESLRAGQFIMTGALHAALDIAPGQSFRAEVDRLGAVSLRIS
jgi:2-keto-4-pentenoate hydratase